MKIALAILLAAVLALAWGLVVQMTKGNQQQLQIAELTSKLKDRTARDNLALQQKCAKRAQMVFGDFDKRLRQSIGIPLLVNYDTYVSHYNAKLNRCFMLTEDSTSIDANATIWTSRDLIDAYEMREYAQYRWHTVKGKKYWEVPPTVCTLLPSQATESTCNSEAEFNAFVARYME